MIHRLIFVWLATFVVSYHAHAQALSLPPDFYDETVGEGWERPVGITFDEQGHGYIWEKKGRVMLLDEEGHKLDEPLIDISEEVDNWSDLGLLGFALDPNFSSNGYFYLLYVVDRHYLDHFGTAEYDPAASLDHVATIGRITRYTADSATGFTSVVEGSRHILLGESWEDGAAILIGSHSVGSLAFGDDGTLLASFGDGGSYESIDTGNTPPTESYWAEAIEKGTLLESDNVGALKALQIQNLNGTIIRIDPTTGSGISSNPFFQPDAPDAPQSKVWAMGFRNPYKFVVIPGTGSSNQENANPGTLFIGDVGSAGWEELNIAQRGGQCFGWPIYEGINSNWGFYSKPTENPYAPNPVVCEQAFFTFNDLLRQPNSNHESTFINPCNPSDSIPIPESIPTFFHTPPALSWSGLLWNPPPKTWVPGFDEDTGELVPKDIGLENSGIPGTEFAGFTSVPGFFYTDQVFPEQFQGAFFQADLSGWIRAIHFDDNYQVTKVDTFARWGDRSIAHLAYNPHDGAIYWCHIYDNELHKITYGGNPRPVAEAFADSHFGPSPLNVQFDASTSFDPNGEPVTYLWDFGDGDTSTDAMPSHLYEANSSLPQSFSVHLTVTDSIGQTDTEELLISLNNSPPQVRITSFRDGERYPINGITYLPLKAEVTDPEHQGSDLTYKWETFLHHNNHYHPNDPKETIESDLIIDPLGCEEETFWYRVRLTVTDASGLSNYDERQLFPNCGEPFFETNDLDAYLEDRKVQVHWTTRFEEGVERFEIQRTADYRFETIDEVPGSGTSAFTVAYSFIDEHPAYGANYYRVKAVNNSGEYHYSNVDFVEFRNIINASVYPNPTANELNIYLERALSENVEFEITSPVGYRLYSNQWEATPGESFNQHLTLQDLPDGIYFYTVKNGDRTTSSSFLLSRD